MSWKDKSSEKEIITIESPEGKRLLGSLQNDLRNISNEAKKKQPSLKEVNIFFFNHFWFLLFWFLFKT